MKDWFHALSRLPFRFIWSSNAVTRVAPHIRDSNNVQRLWNYFLLASLPAWLIGLWSLGHQTNLAIADFRLEDVEGWRGVFLAWSGIGFDASSISACAIHGLMYFVPIFIVALLTGAFWESTFATVRKKQVDEGLLAIAWLFALMMPATVPLYQVALGMTFGMVVGKLIYGGSGRYLVSPALLGLAFLVFSYPTLLFSEGAWVPVAGYDQPSVLELVTDEGGLAAVAAVDYSFWQIFAGARPGPVGAVSTLGVLLGAIFLVFTGVASWRALLGMLIGFITVAMVSNSVAPGNDLFSVPWYWHLVLGGFAFGAVFIATDPVAGPMTNPGRWGFGLLVGSLTMVIRLVNPSYYEGVMFAILLACMFSPLIDFVVTELNIRRRKLRLLEGDG
ncbi:MAG: RnfABCDGE type electron transport complex subunit D [Xanthomonadales bacterium]|jgi:Na+-transporting NADH:ubiquinone oxidoreductase subunit B|nr:RnfABCDGE type electron transport complex subunit D [Xanthomonadales bacterium]MDH3925917.1 RnfABCDGE type electron transport complex subunit D [Xanthomonadales bacterium]MDH3942038.1 RnfABCDGE type electron transport complex subunit D [Xanthomonadales bacterium]MDH4000669.1 RnfABCDGE type electron transport complex subunit D [Xanthomonadales bacterium]